MGWSLRDWSCWKKRSVLLVLLFVNQSRVFSQRTHFKITKIRKGKRSISDWLEDCILVQVRILPLKLRILPIGHLIPACNMSCAPPLERTSSRISIVPCWWGVIWTRARWLFAFLSLAPLQAPSCQKKFLGFFCQFLEKIFLSQSTWIPSKVDRLLNIVVWDWGNLVALLSTESVQNENGLEFFGKLHQPMEIRQNYAINEIIFFSFFDTSSCVLDCDWRVTLFKKGGFCFLKSKLLHKKVYHLHQMT